MCTLTHTTALQPFLIDILYLIHLPKCLVEAYLQKG